jgi:hypothetical protein
MANKNADSKPNDRLTLNPASFATGMSDKELARLAQFQKSVFPGIVESLGDNQALYGSTLKMAGLAASTFIDTKVAAGMNPELARTYPNEQRADLVWHDAD